MNLRAGLRTRALRWIAGLSLVINLALALAWAARQVRRHAPVHPSREQARAALFHELATGSSAHRDVVILGDSLTERGEWWELLDRPVANRGIANDTVEDVRARLGDIVALTPRVLFVLVGVNDLLAGMSPEALARHHAALIVELRGRLPSTRIIVESLLPIRDELVAFDEPLATTTVRRANELLQRGAAAAGADWLDVNAHLVDPTGQLDARYSTDGLHLSAAGYHAWALALRPYAP
jgi:lysophospholipase L1-like esterase